MNPRLIKLLMLTQSPNDNEALIAMRQANKVLIEENKSWEDAFKTAWPAKYEKLRLEYNDLAERFNILRSLLAASVNRPKPKKLFGLF